MYPLFSSCLFFLLCRGFFFLAHLGLSVADPDLQISGGKGKWGRGGGGGFGGVLIQTLR